MNKLERILDRVDSIEKHLACIKFEVKDGDQDREQLIDDLHQTALALLDSENEIKELKKERDKLNEAVNHLHGELDKCELRKDEEVHKEWDHNSSILIHGFEYNTRVDVTVNGKSYRDCLYGAVCNNPKVSSWRLSKDD